MYTLVLAIVFAATYVLQLAIDNQKKRWWIIYAILVAAGMWTHYFCAFAWLAHLVYLIVIYRKRIFQKKIILTYVLAVVLFLPWVPSLLSQTKSVESGFWIAAVSFESVSSYWSQALVYRDASDVTGWLLPLLSIASIILLTFAVKYRQKMKLLLIMAIIPFVSLILLSMPPLTPLFIPRYILFAIVSISLIAGVGLVLYSRSPLPKQKKRAQKALITRRITIGVTAVAFLLTSIAGLVSLYTIGNYNFDSKTKSASKDLYETIVALDGGENLAIISASEWLYYDMSFYSTKEHSVYFMNETTT
jgi:uncharacterized membrane protein